MRLAVCALLTAACAGLGWFAAAWQTRRAGALQALRRAVLHLQEDMLDRRVPLNEAMAKTGHPLFEEAARAVGVGPEQALSDAARRLSQRGGALDCLTRGDLASIDRLAGELGRGSAQRQRLLLTKPPRSWARCWSRRTNSPKNATGSTFPSAPWADWPSRQCLFRMGNGEWGMGNESVAEAARGTDEEDARERTRQRGDGMEGDD